MKKKRGCETWTCGNWVMPHVCSCYGPEGAINTPLILMNVIGLVIKAEAVWVQGPAHCEAPVCSKQDSAQHGN